MRTTTNPIRFKWLLFVVDGRPLMGERDGTGATDQTDEKMPRIRRRPGTCVYCCGWGEGEADPNVGGKKIEFDLNYFNWKLSTTSYKSSRAIFRLFPDKYVYKFAPKGWASSSTWPNYTTRTTQLHSESWPVQLDLH